MTDLFCCGFRVPLEEFLRHQDEPGRAKTALESAVLNKRLLDRMQLIAGSESLDGNHFSAVDKSREIETPAHRDPVDDCRTAAAQPLPATFAGSKKTELAAQNLEQGLMRGDLCNSRSPIQLESYCPAMSFLHYISHSLAAGPAPAATRARRARLSAAFPSCGLRWRHRRHCRSPVIHRTCRSHRRPSRQTAPAGAALRRAHR